MIEYAARMLFTGLRSSLKPRLDPMQESVLRMVVWPTDLDTIGHMNNGRYLTLMDLGRTDLLIRSGLVREAIRRRWSPTLGAANIVFRRSLTPLTRYELRTRVACWDPKWFYIQQDFTRGSELYARGLVRGMLLRRGTKVPPAEMVAAMGGPAESPPVPDAVARWIESLAAFRRS